MEEYEKLDIKCTREIIVKVSEVMCLRSRHGLRSRERVGISLIGGEVWLRFEYN